MTKNLLYRDGKRPPVLDVDKRRDTGGWVKVIGTVWMEEVQAYLKAEWIGIFPHPDDPSMEPVDVEPERVPPVPARPPEILFTMPLEGEDEIPLDTEFMIQFSKDMDRESLAGNVELVYSDGDLQPELALHYDAPKQTLVVRPTTPLLPQKTVHLILQRGIRDDDGIPLVGRISSRRAAMRLGDDASTIVMFTFTTQSKQ